MAAINDIIVSVSQVQSTASRVGFGIPALIGLTGQRNVFIHGSGVSGLVLKTVSRHLTLSVVINTGAFNYAYATDVVTITRPSGTTVRELIADFTANAGAPVTSRLALAQLTTGSGAVATLTSTPLVHTDYRKIIDLSQLDYYYDEADAEYKMVKNVLNSRPSPGTIYLIDVFDAAYVEDISTIVALYDIGDWYLAVTTATDEDTQLEIADYINQQNRLVLFTSANDDALETVQGYRAGFLVHDVVADHPEASWAAKNLTATPGASTWKFTSNLEGQTPNASITLSDLITLRTNKGQAYVEKNGLKYVDGGQLNDPDATTYIDQVWSRDWVEVNLEADLLELFVNASAQGKKIAYTNAGIAQITSVIARRLQLAGQNGIIAPVETPEQAAQSYDGVFRFRIEAPTREAIEAENPSDIVARVLNNVSFTYIEAGAIEIVNEISGRVVLTE